MNAKNRELAKQVITEIVRQSPVKKLTGKTRLFKAFYLAHLFHAKESKNYLTEWPIVKMPNGPGIDNFHSLLAELVQDGTIGTDATQVGPYPATVYWTGASGPGESLSQNAVEAIRKAVEFVKDKTGAQLSDITHEFSLVWNDAEPGEELSVYLDLLSDEDRQKELGRASRISKELEAAWSE